MKNKLITSDIYLAAALLSLGARLDGVDRSDPRHMKFTVVSTAHPLRVLIFKRRVWTWRTQKMPGQTALLW